MSRRGLRHLGIALAAVALAGAGDWATGKHLWRGVSSFADRLAVWYDARRLPGYACTPFEGRPYTKLAGLVFDAPACWKPEVASFLGRDMHRFQDPEAKAGTVSVSVETIGSAEDRQALIAEFEHLSARPGAIVDGTRRGAPPGEDGEDEDDPSGGAATGRTATGSLAEALERQGFERAAGPAGQSGAPQAGVRWVHRVRTRGEIGATASAAGGVAEAGDAAYARSVWSWLLIGDHVAVRVVYNVRKSWTDESVVVDEFELVRKLVDSIRPSS